MAVISVHPSAMIHEGAHVAAAIIGARTKVWQFASIIRGAKIGEDCNIASTAIIDGASLGDRCIVGHGTSIHPGARLGNDVFVGPCVTFCNDAWPRVAKDGFDVGQLVRGEIVSIVVGDGASIGAGAVVLPGVVIGERAMVAATAVVDRNVPADHIFKRSGAVCPIDAARAPRRMRQAVA